MKNYSSQSIMTIRLIKHSNLPDIDEIKRFRRYSVVEERKMLTQSTQPKLTVSTSSKQVVIFQNLILSMQHTITHMAYIWIDIGNVSNLTDNNILEVTIKEDKQL